MKLRKIKLMIAAVVLGSSPLLVKQSYADDTAQNISIAKFISALKISGDMRVRQENFWKSANGQKDRSRQRFRFRLGIQPQIDDVTVGFRLASGTGEQISTNQSFDNLFSQKQIFIDQAYIQWKAFEWLKLTGGRMNNPFWRLYSSDLVWDDDVNPEGFAQQLEYKFHERLTGFVNLGQFALDEDSTDNRDQWMFGYQAGIQTKWFKETKWNLSAALYDLDNERVSTFDQNTANEGNSRVLGSGISTVTANFTMLHLSNEFKTKVGPLPISLQADYVVNIADNGQDTIFHGTRVVGSSSTEKVGYQIGGIIGKASAANTWEAAYFFKWLETNASVADLADADFGDGGTNRRGHIFWVAYNPREYLQLKAKMFVTEVLRPNLAPGPDHINRLQIDLSVKF
jgi:hypothetical protein